MTDTTAHAAGKAPAVAHVRHGEHVDTIESVDAVFREQRKLSFTYGAIFFAVTLAIPAASVWWEDWYAKPIWGGFTANYLFVSLFYYVFLWVMAWTYSKQADKLDEKLARMAEEIAARSLGEKEA
ncbi:DUF485 domain-containing protein [Coriobacteriia bacterium Es71-Z0120]|uniref:DUF485 domain-containing protein n=1 Tax=Parvivirga hydrogeniphila TaxID=2939460 RepID=UPI0022608477|nr:DUF485 domain-containing protein [Parvivirga hydrogeniphila]MCL4078348.1 DUF485 domain-containing protein [Parvivirga hydrogeniphila]